MSSFTVIHGPPASGKTFHSIAFRRHYGCHAAIDLEELPKMSRDFQKDGALFLTTLAPDDAVNEIYKFMPGADYRIIDIRTARLAIGATPDVPPLPARRPKS
ncbi:hypothetical protein ACQKE8_12845 [Sphingobium limneticum]|uniref:hypothetical protein n=1 Tax=Sphingobium limneticum TaxID=1007511 RepID=UPI003D053284